MLYAADPSREALMLFENGDRIVFTGDSVTDAERKRPIGEGLWEGVGNGYVRQIENILNVVYPDRLYWISNTGCSGDNSRDLLNRWQNDVMNLKPDWVSVMIGVNDCWQRFFTPAILTRQVFAAEYKQNLCEMMERTLPVVKGMVLLSPYYIESNREDSMRAAIDEYVGICAEVAKKYNTVFVNTQQAFDEYLVYRHSSCVAWDRVHPGPIGSAIIAREFLKAVGMDRSYI
ncbi:MAG: GDSL family lipase [Ruminococcaceae bacterium]|nr:GDSL family lipase [Oscillospiraceae bacterium]